MDETLVEAIKRSAPLLTDAAQKLVSQLEHIEQHARHAADPREPAAQLAGAFRDYFTTIVTGVTKPATVEA